MQTSSLKIDDILTINKELNSKWLIDSSDKKLLKTVETILKEISNQSLFISDDNNREILKSIFF